MGEKRDGVNPRRTAKSIEGKTTRKARRGWEGRMGAKVSRRARNILEMYRYRT